MTKQQLETTFAWFHEKPGRITALRGVNCICTYGTVAVFAETCAELALRRDPALLRLGLTCGVPFLALSALRARLDAPRPYEGCGLGPPLPRSGFLLLRGRSRPRRLHLLDGLFLGASQTLQQRHMLIPFLNSRPMRCGCPPAAWCILYP